MKSALLGLAAPLATIAALTLPTAASAETQSLATAGFSSHGAFQPLGSLVGRPAGGSHVRIHRGGGFTGTPDDHRRRRHRDDNDVVVGGGWYDASWGYYNNRSWEPDSYNDWWHDRPDRAYPAWMRRNKDCARQWYSGDTLVC